MSDNTNANPERTDEQKELIRQAKQLAADQGHNWKELSKEDRKAFKKSIKADLKQAGSGASE